MEAPDVRAVVEFLRRNGLAETESALRDDLCEKGELDSFDFERFLFPMPPPPPPVRVPSALQQSEAADGVEDSESSSGADDEFVSLGSSEFMNPYGLCAATPAPSESSSDQLSQFGTARAYPDFDMQNDLWYNDKDDDLFLPPTYGGSEFLGCPSEDKFVMTSDMMKQCERPLMSHAAKGLQSFSCINYPEKSFIYNVTADDDNEVHVTDYYSFNEKFCVENGIKSEIDNSAAYDLPKSLCDSCVGAKGFYCDKCDGYSDASLEKTVQYDYPSSIVEENLADSDSVLEQKINGTSNFLPERCSVDNRIEDVKSTTGFNVHVPEKDYQPNDGHDLNDGEAVTPLVEADVHEEEDLTADELPMYNNSDDDFEVFNLKIIHRKNRTGFEEHKDFPILLNTMIGGRYYVTEYLGSAAFSRVVQAHDIDTGVDVCLKIIKNDKDFFDQSLDEIKLLKLVNKHDPLDERHILRLYDYFYHQEHLFIVCELLRANLYEFQKYNQESDGEAYFTLSRLQVIARQCLEALEYLHDLSIIHCDLKPENILIKSYSRCEIKVIDLGSSCFVTDNLCLYVQSRSYRAPEVILGLPYDQKIDIWSLGCILAELWSGEVLFPNDALVMLLARMIGMIGPIDLEMLVRGQETTKYFTNDYDLYHINEETNQVEYIIPESSSLEHHLQVCDIGFINFVRDLLEINPERRPTASEALEHPWLSHPYDF